MNRRARMFVRADLVASSPIRLSSGLDNASDSDVLVDSTGTPFLPGTSLAGVMRHYVCAVRKLDVGDGASYVNRWFGHIVPGQDLGSQSLLCVHDAFPTQATHVSLRDGVKLTDDKTVDATHKFDYQVVDEGAVFGLRMELECDVEEGAEADDLLSTIVHGFESGQILVGGKTSRGFGKLGIRDVGVLRLDLNKAEDVRRYIDFDWEAGEFRPFEATGEQADLYEEPRCVRLAVASSLMIRDYATVARSGYEQKLVDAQTLEGANGNPIIPGTSWAGAFRHHIKRVLMLAGYDTNNTRGDTAEAFVRRVFGDVDGARGVASKIEFSQSEISGSRPINLTRTAIDRFTGAVADQKLFTNRLAFGGTTTLSIRWRKSLDEADKALLASLVDVCVDDLLDGTLAVGGMTATGSGMFCKAADEKVEVTA